MIKKSLFIISLIFTSIQGTFAGLIDTPSDSSEYKTKMYVGAHVGSFGFGIQFAYPLSDMITLRATGSYAPSFSTTITGTEEGAATSTDYIFQTGGAGIIGDFSFFPSKPGIRLSAGALYNTTKANANRSYYLESEDLDLGTLSMEFTPKSQISPYLGVSFGNLKKSKRVFFSMEIGALYHSRPQLSFSGDGYIAPTANESNTSIIENNVKSFQFFPYMNMQLNFKL